MARTIARLGPLFTASLLSFSCGEDGGATTAETGSSSETDGSTDDGTTSTDSTSTQGTSSASSAATGTDGSTSSASTMTEGSSGTTATTDSTGDTSTGSTATDSTTGPSSTGSASGTDTEATGSSTGVIAVCGDGMPEGDEDCDDGNMMPYDGCENDCSTSHNYVFVTSTEQRPDQLGGLQGADNLCTQLAVGAGLPGTYMAFLASSTSTAAGRIAATGARGWKRVDGRPFADEIEPLMGENAAAQPWYPVALDENGTLLSISEIVVTGTAITGLADSSTCGDWNSNSLESVSGGVPDAGGFTWYWNVMSGCANQVWRLMCFGVDHSAPLVIEPAVGRRAFLSKNPLLLSAMGISAADDLCSAEASMAGYAGTFKALLASDGASAVSRFDLDADPWVRPDGVAIVADANDLASGTLLAPLDVAPDLTFGSFAAWAGATGPATPGTAETSCESFTVTTGNAQRGSAHRSSTDWFLDGVNACNASWVHLYCLED